MNNENTTFNIKNFGPVKQANVEVAPLTIFIGPNSCGKSFIANLIHTYSHLLYDRFKTQENINDFSFDSLFNLLKNSDDYAKKFYSSIMDYYEKKPSISDKPLEIPLKFIYKLLDKSILQDFSKLLQENLTKNFDKDVDKLIMIKEDYFEVKWNNLICLNSKDNEFSVSYNYENFHIKANEQGEENIALIFTKKDDSLFINMDFSLINMIYSKNTLPFVIFSILCSDFFNNLNLQDSLYIPASRDEFFKNRDNLLKKINRELKFPPNEKELFENLFNAENNKSPFFDLGHELEKELFCGEITFIDDSISNEIQFLDLKTNEIIPSELLSTSITELSSFIIYLKYVLKKGDILIFEEPEAHLHPANQRILVKYFVKAINNGLNIILTTHSDFIVDQINNLIQLGNLDKEDLKKLNYTDEDVLNFDDINIYNFKDKDNFFVTEKIAIDKWGFEENNFKEVVEDLYDESTNILDLG